MAKEYIEREAVLALKKPFPTSKDSVTLYQQYFISPTAVEKIPAADVRPVIFCRDCTHCFQGKESLECEKHRYEWNDARRWVNEDDYCCWGKKREVEHENG